LQHITTTAGTAGAVDVTSPGGTIASSSADQFTYGGGGTDGDTTRSKANQGRPRQDGSVAITGADFALVRRASRTGTAATRRTPFHTLLMRGGTLTTTLGTASTQWM